MPRAHSQHSLESTLPSPMSVPTLVLSGEIAITTGTLAAPHIEWQSEKLIRGLKVVIIESGELLCRFPRQQELHISGPSVCTVWNQDEAEAAQCFLPGKNLRYTSVCLSSATINQYFSTEVAERLAQGMNIDLAARPAMRVQQTPNTLQSVQAQLLACPMQGVARQLFLTGKALEIVALSIDNMMTDKSASQVAVPRLNSGDVARLHEAKFLLETRLDTPPSLNELSLRVGMNTRKLTTGFRRLFGESIYAYLQNFRLETAWRLLAAGEVRVSKVAYQIGYTPAHLSVAFRKKYGFAPKNLRG